MSAADGDGPTRRGLLRAGAAAGVGFAALQQPARAASTDLLRFGLSAYPPNLLPWVSTGAAAATVKLLCFRGLVGWQPSGALGPELATDWSADPDGVWTFRLRPDAVFSNGEPVTADDVKWTIEQVAGPKSTAFMRGQFQDIARVDVPDPHTVRIATKTPIVTLPIWFASAVGIVWRKSDPAAPIGSGPYVVASQERGTSVEVKKFDRYYKPGLPRIGTIRFLAYADENARVAALHAGDVDIIEYVPWQAMASMQADPSLRLSEVNGAAFMDILFNGGRPPFNDPRVRQAIAHAVRREDIVRAVFFGRGSVLAGVPVEPGTPFFDATLAQGWAYDPDRARQLLSAAGYPDGFKSSLLATAQYSMHKDTAEIVQQYLGAIGIAVELKLPEWGARVTLGNRGQYEMAIHGVSADSNDPDGLSIVLDTSLPPTFSRSYDLQAPRTVAALARGRAEFDPAKRVAIYREMQTAALEEVPLVGLAWRSQGYGMTPRVRGFTNLPGALSTYSGSTLETASLV